MSRVIAWILRVVCTLPLLWLVGYSLVAPADSPVRLAYRLFIPVVGLFVVAIWTLTQAKDAREPQPGEATDTRDT